MKRKLGHILNLKGGENNRIGQFRGNKGGPPPSAPTDGGPSSLLGVMTPPPLVRLTSIAMNAARTSVIGAHRRWRDVASGKLGKGGRDVGSNSETFRWNPVGNQSHPVELGRQPEASLAWGPAMVTAKRRQRVPRPCYGASKENVFVGALVVIAAGAASACRHGLARRSCRGLRTGHQHTRILQEPERSQRLHGHGRTGLPAYQPLARVVRVPTRERK